MRDFNAEINSLKARKEVYYDLTELLKDYEADLKYYKETQNKNAVINYDEHISLLENKISLIVGVIEYAEQVF